MSDINDWIAAGRNYADAIDKDRGFESGVTDCLRGLSDALEVMAREVERLTKSEAGLLKTLGLERRVKHEAQTERDRLKSALERCQAIGCSQVKEIAHRAISSLPISDCSCKIEMGSFRFRGSHCILCGGVIV